MTRMSAGPAGSQSQPSKPVIKLRALRVHQRTANDGHRRAPAVNLRSRPLTIPDGFCGCQQTSASAAMWWSGAGRTADLPLFRHSINSGPSANRSRILRRYAQNHLMNKISSTWTVPVSILTVRDRGWPAECPGAPPPPSRAPEDHFQPLHRNDRQDPPLSGG